MNGRAAAASAILGRSDAALAHLENLVRSGFRNGAWARIERDPAFASLRSMPRFQAIVSGLQVWRQGEVRQLALMRLRGRCPFVSSEQLSQRGVLSTGRSRLSPDAGYEFASPNRPIRRLSVDAFRPSAFAAREKNRRRPKL